MDSDSLHARIDIRWPQYQTLISGAASDSAEAAIGAGFEEAAA
jgi:hypothetical protein